MNHVVSFSGGLGSWMTAKMVAKRFGTDNLYLVFCDVKLEDPDLYRFLEEAAADIGGTFIKLCDGRDTFDVFEERRMIGNSKTAPCSYELKVKPFYDWIDANFDIDDVTIYIGIDFTEAHRLDSARNAKPRYRIEAPLCEPPFMLKLDIIKELEKTGIQLPRLYRLGFSHNNCSGACIKAGTGQFKMLYEKLPDVYRKFEEKQEALIEKVPDIQPFLHKTEKGKKVMLTMKEFRERYLEKNADIDNFDIGGCGCFLE